MHLNTTNIASPETTGFCPQRLRRADELIARYIDEGKIPGAITLVSRRGLLAHFNIQGYSNIEEREPMRENSLFRIYSMTKIITSVALLVVYERGLLDLNDPVAKYIPAFDAQQVRGENGSLVPAHRPTTVYDLLRNCGGLPNPIDLEELMGSAHTLESFVAGLGRMPLIAQPGTQWIYGYSADVIARLIEVVCGTSFDRFLQQEIFQPLAMTDTGFDLAPEKIPRLTTCYRHSHNGRLIPIDGNASDSLFVRKKSFLSGSAGLISAPRDYLRFATMLLNRGQLDDVRILGRKTVGLMTMDHLPEGHPNIEIGSQSFRFGLGVSVVTDVAPTRCLSSVGDFGWGGSAGTQVWINPQEAMVVMIMIQVRADVPTGIMDIYKRLIYQALID